MITSLIIALLSFGCVYFGSRFLLSKATSFGLIANVNSRSAHTTATPLGGGIPIAIVMSVSCLVLELLHGFSTHFAAAFLVGGFAVAIVALIDDLFDLNSWTRLSVYVAASCWVVYWIGPVPAFTFPRYVFQLGWTAFPLTLFFIVWMINLFNFMDGIDGLVTSQSIAFGICLWLMDSGSLFGLLCLSLASACLGFLRWNFPVAKIFLGDIGATFLGFLIALILVKNSPKTDWVASGLILLIPLTVDATMTLMMRLLAGENIFKAHKKHLYQQLAMRFKSHCKVTLGYLTFQVCVLFPLAIVCSQPGASSAWILHIAYFVSCSLWVFLYYYVVVRQTRPRQSQI